MTRGSALIATGSPFEPVFYDGKTYDIAQCNNAYIFPGLGLGILASKAQRVTEAMLITCSKTLAAHSPLASRETGALLPPVEEIEMISRAIAAEVACAARTALRRRLTRHSWRRISIKPSGERATPPINDRHSDRHCSAHLTGSRLASRHTGEPRMFNALIVDDDPMVADLNRLFISRVADFSPLRGGGDDRRRQSDAESSGAGRSVAAGCLYATGEWSDLLLALRADGGILTSS